MKRQKSSLGIKLVAWVVTEILLTLVGLDNLADYSEFIFARELQISQTAQANSAIVRIL